MDSVTMSDPPETDEDLVVPSDRVDRVELYREASSGQKQTLHMKMADMKLDHIAKVFKVNPETLYLEEDITKNAELAGEDGKFSLQLRPYQIGKYRVCGETIDQLGWPSQSQQQTPLGASSSELPPLPRYLSRARPGRNGSRPSWNAEFSTLGSQRTLAEILATEQSGSSHNTPLSKRSRTTGGNDSFWKRTIQYVELGIRNGRDLCIDSTLRNLFLKLPETAVSASSIIAEAASSMNLQDELILLDSKFIPISADVTTDPDFWKTPSRRFYLVNAEQYDRMMKVIKRNKKPLKLQRRDYGEQRALQDTDSADEIKGINDFLSKISMDINEVKEIANMNLLSMAKMMPFFECKICKDIPTLPIMFVTCCQQIIGCKVCLDPWIVRNKSCPLCRKDAPTSFKVNGCDQSLQVLRCLKSPPSGSGTGRGLEEQ